MTITLFLQVLAIVLLLLAAIQKIQIQANPWVHLGWLGLFFWFLALLLGK